MNLTRDKENPHVGITKFVLLMDFFRSYLDYFLLCL